jgi:hypothetical protein
MHVCFNLERVRAGVAALRIVANGPPSAPCAIGVASPRISVDAGRSYLLRGWMRVTQGTHLPTLAVHTHIYLLVPGPDAPATSDDTLVYRIESIRLHILLRPPCQK